MSERRKLLWESKLDAEMYGAYWQLVFERQTKISTILQVVIAISSSSAFATLFLLQDHPMSQRYVAGFVGVLAILSATLYSPDQLKKASSAANLWNEVATHYKILWAEDPDLIAGKNWEEFKRFKTKADAGPLVGQLKQFLLDAQKQVLRANSLSFPGANSYEA